METDTKHKALVKDYINKSNLEIIVENSIRSIVQSNLLPDNPYGAMTRHFTYFATKDDMNRLNQKVKAFEIKPLSEPELFSITSQKNKSECYGLAHLLHYVDVNQFKVLHRSLKELCMEHRRTYGQYTLEVRVAIGGGEIFKSKLVPHSEVSPNPLEIHAECLVEGPKFENAFTLFADYVYEDIMRIGSNNSLNLVRDFCLEQGPKSTNVKRVKFDIIQENKQILINELKNATVQKRVSYIRVLVFSHDLDRYKSNDIIRAVTPSRLLGTSEPSVMDHFQFISMKKMYVMHYSLTGNPGEFNSLAPVPCSSLFNSLFPNPDSAKHYAKIFYSEKQNPYETQPLEMFLDYKRDRIIKYYKTGKAIKMTWETLDLVLANKDHAQNIGIINEIFCLFSHPSCKLYKILKIVKALVVLINSYYDTNFEHFKKLAEGLFVRLKEECWSAFGNASSPELLILKTQIIKMLDSTSINKSRALSLSPSTLRILERLQSICESLTVNTTELLMRHLALLTEAHLRLLLSYSITPGQTYNNLTESKQTPECFDVDQEIKNQNVKRENEYTIIYDYIINTGILDVLIVTTRDLILGYPMLPNPLKTYAANIMKELFKYDMFKQSALETLEKNLSLPTQVADRIYVHSSPNNMYEIKNLPYIVGSEEILMACTWQEIGFFKLIFLNYELIIENFKDILPKSYNIQITLSVCGQSLQNQEILSKFPSTWHVYYDVFVIGPNFNAASHGFLDLLMKYALWLEAGTDASVIGFYTQYSDKPLARFSEIVSLTDRKTTVGLILSAIQMNSKVWLRFIIPYKGDPDSQVIGVPIAVHAYFNMHFRVDINKKITSLMPLNSLEDIAKVFYSRESYELWFGLIDFSSLEIKEKLINEMTSSFDIGQHYRGSVCLLMLKLIQKDKNAIGKLMRINDTPFKSIMEAANFIENLIDLYRLSHENHRKSNPEYGKDTALKLLKYTEAVFMQERNIMLENAQLAMIRITGFLMKSISNSNGPKYLKSLSLLKHLFDHFNVGKLISSIIIQDILGETNSFQISN